MMVIGTNKLAQSLTRDMAKSLGYEIKIITGNLMGDVD